jgi:hypothetical protein
MDRARATLGGLTALAVVFLCQAPAGASARPATAAAGGRQAALAGVSCPEVTLCVAVGIRGEAHGRAPLAEKWNGHSWQVMRMPAVGAADAGLTAVSCPSATNCTAVGAEDAASASSRPLAEQWNGHRWRVTQASDPHGIEHAYLTGVSCPRTGRCEAVGAWQTKNRLRTLIEKWTGRSWRVQHGAPVSRSALLAAVHCTGSLCMAVGQIENAHRTLVTLAEKWTGHAWSRVSRPSPAGTNFAALEGAWCTSPSFCLSVGQTQGTTTGAIAQAWNGSAWSSLPLSAIGDVLFGVACTSPVSCIAVGSGPTRPVSERWTGSWHSVPTARVSGVPFAYLTQVSCPAAGRCIAVGARTNGSPADIGASLAEEWNGTSWTVLPTINPGG